MKGNPHRKKIRWISKIIKWATIYLMLQIIVSDVVYWMFNGFSIGDWQFHMISLPSPEGGIDTPVASLAAMQRFAGFLISLIPTGCQFVALFWLRSLVIRYQHMEVFSWHCVHSFRNIGWALLIKEISFPIAAGLHALVLTAFQVRERIFVLEFDVNATGMILVSLGIIMVSWIMEEACQLEKEEHVRL